MNLHLGYRPGQDKPEGQANERNGASGKTVLTEHGPVRVELPRAISISYTTHQPPGRDMSIQTLSRCSIILFLTALTSGCSIGNECAWYRSSCMYEGQYEQGEEDYAESEAQRLNKNSTDRLRRSSGD